MMNFKFFGSLSFKILLDMAEKHRNYYRRLVQRNSQTCQPKGKEKVHVAEKKILSIQLNDGKDNPKMTFL